MGRAMSDALVPRSIHTPAELSAVLRDIRQAVGDGVLEEVEAERSSVVAKLSLVDVPENGPWPDYIELWFRDRKTNTRYRLRVETYHGTGGDWMAAGTDDA